MSNVLTVTNSSNVLTSINDNIILTAIESTLLTVNQGDVTVNTIIGAIRLEKEFTHESFADGKLLVGKSTLDMREMKIVCLIDEIFDEGTITIGDEGAHGRLVTAEQFDIKELQAYHAEPDYEYTTATNIYIYFETGSPVTGSGTIIIYQS